MIASNYQLPEVRPEEDYPLEISIDKGTIFDGDADDNFMLYPFLDNTKEYTNMKYETTLEWAYYTEGRALKIIEIIRSVLQHTESVELWNFWLGDLGENERPIIKAATISLAELSTQAIQEWDIQQVWNSPSRYGDSPTFYCLRIVR